MSSKQEFRWDDYCWSCSARLAAWSGFQSRNGPYGQIDAEAPSDGTVTIVFAPEGRDESPLSAKELQLVDWAIDNQRLVAEVVQGALFERYPEWCERLEEECELTKPERQRVMPDIESPDGLQTILGVVKVFVHQVEHLGLPYIGFELGCNWDDEHGIGVLMHGTRVVEIGGADTAMLLWIAKRDVSGGETVPSGC